MWYQKTVDSIAGVGEKKKQYLNQLGLYSMMDIIFHFPFRYENWSLEKSVNSVDENEEMVFYGKLYQVEETTSRSGKSVIRGLLQSDQGMICAIWFNQAWLKRSLFLDKNYLIFGKKSDGYNVLVKTHVLIKNQDRLKDYLKIHPIYPGSAKLVSKDFERLSSQVLAKLEEEPLPEVLDKKSREKYGLLSINQAFFVLHQPKHLAQINEARHSMIVYEWLFFLSWLATFKKDDDVGHSLTGDDEMYWSIIKSLPFQLTNAQKRVISEIKVDLESDYMMRRLLQGDVGSGKTLVALYALLKGYSSGGQAVMLAPTEILAKQHYEKMKVLLEAYPLKLAYYSGQTKGNQRKACLLGLSDGSIDIVIGTHALLEEGVVFQNLKVAVIDEQHRFGVQQREKLYKKGEYVDTLVMTATPIPRSLALSLYGNLKHSVIDELPKGRENIKTYWITDKKREGLYQFIKEHLQAGEQAYFVCPLIQESEVMDLKNAEALHAELTKTFFPYRVALLHGKMKNDEKTNIMSAFLNKEIELLVSTTVIEVGIDVANASIMVIENAERFGLAQLHQLRGRVGRGRNQSFAFLISNSETDEVKKRMSIMVKAKDGFEIAEEDLKVRGPGELLGLRQHGLPVLKIADFREHVDELIEARKIYSETEMINLGLYKNYLKESVRL